MNTEKSAEMVTRSAARSLIASSSQQKIEQDEISTCDSLASVSSDIGIIDHQSKAPVPLQGQSTYTHADDGTATQDLLASAKKMAQGNLRDAEKGLKDFETRWRQTGDRPKVKGGRPRMQRRIEQCRAIPEVLPLVTVTDQPAGRTRGKNGATLLLALAQNKAKDLVKAQKASNSRSEAEPRSDILNGILRTSALISRYPGIPGVPTILDQAVARGLLAQHGVDVEKAMMEIETVSPTPHPKRKRNRKMMFQAPVGGSSKANPITID